MIEFDINDDLQMISVSFDLKFWIISVLAFVYDFSNTHSCSRCCL